MKRTVLRQNWQLKRVERADLLSAKQLDRLFETQGEGRDAVFEIDAMPAQVHDVLLHNKMIENPNIRGHNNDLWVDDYEWVYRCRFAVDEPSLPSRLAFWGLDTFAKAYLNGEPVGEFDNAYMRHKTDFLRNLQRENTLLLCFRSSKRVVGSVEIPEKYEGMVPGFAMTRAFRSGFQDYNGPIPTMIRCGIYAPVILEQTETLRIEEVKIDALPNENYTAGTVTASLTVEGGEGKKCLLSVCDSDGHPVAEGKGEIAGGRVFLTATVENPRLWWPRTHGEPCCYRAEIRCGGEDGDRAERTIAFRKIELVGDFDFRVNGRPLKLWGANLAHPDTLTNCHQSERMKRLLFLSELGNFNILRVWGEGEVYDEELYEECDRRGILIWHDFYLCYSMYGEEPDFMEKCRLEAEQLVKRLRHHPCILLWCGGNEMLLSRDYDFPGKRCFGERIVREVFPEVCKKNDPIRYYHISSPTGGGFANDPSAGDTHGYTHLWFVPGRTYPVFLSENCRVSTPPMRTMKRMMTGEELWPDGYTAKVTRREKLRWPESWCRHNTNFGHLKLGPIEHYYDADTPEEMVYRIGAAHAEYIRRQVERFRRGYGAESAEKKRVTKGHMLWKLNNNSNIISYGVIDYFLEPYYPYYALKRAYEPLLLCCEFADHGYVWLINDTQKEVRGTLEVKLFDMEANEYLDGFETDFDTKPDESKPVCSLDRFGQFKKRYIVCAKALSDGGTIASCTDVFELERHLDYPENTGLEIVRQGDELVVTARRFARCVELSGSEDGDEFGWLFSDNYFDLLPGEEKRIAVFGDHRKGIVTAKAFYDDLPASVEYAKL